MENIGSKDLSKIESEILFTILREEAMSNLRLPKFKVYANFQTQKVSLLTDIPWPRKLGAETQDQEEVGKRDESVKVNILKCIIWFRNLTVIFRISVVWNEIRIGDKKTGLRRILSRFIVWSLWHQLIIIVLSQESNLITKTSVKEDRDVGRALEELPPRLLSTLCLMASSIDVSFLVPRSSSRSTCSSIPSRLREEAV